MSNNLVPEQRPDKNGVVVTRHVRVDKGQSVSSQKLSGLSAPAIASNGNTVAYVRAASPFNSDPHRSGHYTKVAMTSTGKRMYMSLASIPEGVDPDELVVDLSPTFKGETTPAEQAEFDQQAKVFAYEAAAANNSVENVVLPAEMVPEGAYVDFNGCAYIPREDWDEHSFEYAEVEEVEKNDNEVILHTNQGSISLPADYALPAFRQRLNEITPVYSNEQVNEAADAAIRAALDDARYFDWEDEDVDADAFDIDNITDETRNKFRALIKEFVRESRWAVSASGVTPDELGHDFYMVSAGHGVGYSDRENIPVTAANELESVIRNTRGLLIEGSSMYLGDDGIPYWGA